MKAFFACLLLVIIINGVTHADKETPLDNESLHVMGGGAVCFFAASLPAVFLNRKDRLTGSILTTVTGLSSSLMAGVFKEIIDKQGYGTVETRDVLNTLYGGLIASMAVVYIYSVIDGKNKSSGAGKLISLSGMGTILLIPVIQSIARKKKRQSYSP